MAKEEDGVKEDEDDDIDFKNLCGVSFTMMMVIDTIQSPFILYCLLTWTVTAT